jgi:large subunit ribosomal protein L3
MPGLIGRKVGMTQVFEPDGKVVPVTILEARPNTVVRMRTVETDGYAAVQLGAGVRKPKHTSKPLAGYYKAQGVEPRRTLREFAPVKSENGGELTVGQEVTVAQFEPGTLVDVIGTNKGKGFQGVMKRHNFVGGFDSHGSKTGRMPGSVGSSEDPSEVWKGKKLPGRMGGVRQTVRNLKVVGVDPESHLLWVLGAVPGAMNGIVLVRPAIQASTRRKRHALGIKIQVAAKTTGGTKGAKKKK